MSNYNIIKTLTNKGDVNMNSAYENGQQNKTNTKKNKSCKRTSSNWAMPLQSQAHNANPRSYVGQSSRPSLPPASIGQDVDVKQRAKVSKDNVTLLRNAYTHAVARGDNPGAPYWGTDARLKINKKPKIAQLLERNNALPLHGVPTRRSPVSYILNTPFGTVNICINNIKQGNQVRLIKPLGSSIAPLYKDINKDLWDYVQAHKDECLSVLNELLKYLSSQLTEGYTIGNVLEEFNKIVKEVETKNASEEQRKSLAALAGILMFCESGQDRSENGGKRERGIVREIIKIVYSSELLSEDLFEHYVPAYSAVRGPERTIGKLKIPGPIIIHGGNIRGKVLVGKVGHSEVNPPISEETLKNDKKLTDYLELSSSSESDYSSKSDILEVEGRRYKVTDNLGLIGGCLWRILKKHGITEKDLIDAAKKSGTEYNKFVDVEKLGNLIKEINKKGHKFAFHLDVFNYDGTYSKSTSGYIPNPQSAGAEIIYIAIIYDGNGMGHFVEKLK